MRAGLAFLRFELLVQSRSLRSRAIAGLWIALSSLPAVIVYLRRQSADVTGASTYAAETLPWLVPLTAITSFFVASEALVREREEGSWTTLSLCGMSTAGYVLYRWVAVLVLLVGTSAVPLVVAASLALLAGQPPAVGSFFWPWLLRVAPAALIWSALGLGFGTATGSLLAGAGLGVAVSMAAWLLGNRLLYPFGLHFDPSPLPLRPLLAAIGRLGENLSHRAGHYDLPFPLLASAVTVDARVLAEQWLGPLLPVVALAAVALLGAILVPRRTRRDLPPWRVPADHPLSTFLALARRLRDHFAPDAGVAPADVLVITLGALVAAAALGGAVLRDLRLVHHAARRFAVEGSPWPPPTPASLVARGYRISGELQPSGAVRLHVVTEWCNQGPRAVGAMALVLDPALRVLRVATPRHGIGVRRLEHRLELRFVPPLGPGEIARVQFVLGGTPGKMVFSVPASRDYGGFLSFHRAFGRAMGPRFASDLIDLSGSYRVRGLSPARVDLVGASLIPLPRYTPFGLSDGADSEGPEETAETILPSVPLAVALRVPAATWLADACGDIATGGRLSGGCTVAANAFRIVGGSQRQALVGGLTVATLPGHRAALEERVGGLAPLRDLVHEVWPTEDLLAGAVLVEWPGDDLFLPDGRMTALERTYGTGPLGQIQVAGRLLLVPEVSVVQGPPLPPGALAAEIVASRLLARRRIAAEQALLFAHLLEAIAHIRAGYGEQRGAVVPASQFGPAAYRLRLLAAGPGDYPVWLHRLPALLVDLENRIGAGPLQQGIDVFLRRSTAAPGTLAELVADWESAGAISLASYDREFLDGDALPQLDLAGVKFLLAGEGWEVQGKVVNSGAGEAHCSVVLISDVARSVSDLVVPTHGQASFTFASHARPRAVLLDPDERCLRYRSLIPPPVERVDFRGLRDG